MNTDLLVDVIQGAHSDNIEATNHIDASVSICVHLWFCRAN